MAVLVTRPGEQGETLVKMLNNIGIAALHLPLFNINSGEQLNQLPNKISALNAGDYVFAVSRNAADYAAQTLTNAGFRWREDLVYFSVGRQSAAHLSALSEQPVHYPCGQESSEGLLALSAMQRLEGKRILILRGNGGREYFAEQAALRGAQTETLECYRRQPIEYDNIQQTSICKRAGIQTLIVTSGEILNSLIAFVPESEYDWLKQCRLITVSRRIEREAIAFGWHNTIIAAGADNNSLLQAVLTAS
ncbi:uroporphyrinogen-III synthase [Mesocricetibacter intestinalis]|uniref:Uroporphyrinogen-III synthase n=1 Tax=Mesocricetibacter intestinalis TaxID=1521930 RepID=A0A4R6V8C5_9PAST|nr:uroporphyrinogen-III synthase [Mesocricetibacter intestinalis]TDQ57604.1 uroporphyrinogen-III synthase [Mesocricetibacter intestinalis]